MMRSDSRCFLSSPPAGHLLSTAEVESALVEHEAVAEAAVVGRPHPVKGESLYCFVTLSEGVTFSRTLEAELRRQGRWLQPTGCLLSIYTDTVDILTGDGSCDGCHVFRKKKLGANQRADTPAAFKKIACFRKSNFAKSRHHYSLLPLEVVKFSILCNCWFLE